VIHLTGQTWDLINTILMLLRERKRERERERERERGGMGEREK
jgi:hypothetical protein